MKDKEKVIIKETGLDDWLPAYWFQCTFPIVELKDNSKKEIVGASFLLLYRKIPYIVTAKHVINFENPIVRFTLRDKRTFDIESNYFRQLGLEWIPHQKTDLAAIPINLPLKLVKKISKFPLKEEVWSDTIKLKNGDEIRHLGYPEQATTHYPDGKPSNYPQGMNGKIISVNTNEIVVRSPAQYGASGGPLFVRSTTGPHLIGVIVKTTVKTKPTNALEGEYQGVTTAIPIRYVRDILVSDRMKQQYSKKKNPEDMF